MPHKDPEAARAYQAAYAKANRIRKNAQAQERWARDRERLNARRRQWQLERDARCPEAKKRRQEKNAAWRKAHPDKARAIQLRHEAKRGPRWIRGVSKDKRTEAGKVKRREQEIAARPQRAEQRRAARPRYYAANRDRLLTNARAQYARMKTAAVDIPLRCVLRRYGLSVNEYSAKFAAQHGACAICGRTQAELPRAGANHKLHVDHDHATGVVRDLLCHACNSMIGHGHDNPEILTKAAAYLLRHERLRCEAATARKQA